MGAGLAGLSLADALMVKGHKILVVDRYGLGSGASGTPLGLVNPATGRKAHLGWQVESCYQAISDNLQKIQETSAEPFFSKPGVIRPAIDEQSYINFSQAYERDDWPEGWCSWITADDIKKDNPYLTETRGGLFVKVGLAVNLPAYLKSYAEYLKNNSVTIVTHQNYLLDRSGNNWVVKSELLASASAHTVTFACGHAMAESPWWPTLPIHPVKGQISRYSTPEPIHWDIPIAASGYFARSGINEFVVGGTYEHTFENDKTDAHGMITLQKKLNQIMPSLLKVSSLTGQWAGIRASTPNRLPIIGPHFEEPGLNIFAGLGSKGMLYSKYTADILADYLADGKPLPSALSTERFAK